MPESKSDPLRQIIFRVAAQMNILLAAKFEATFEFPFPRIAWERVSVRRVPDRSMFFNRLFPDRADE